MKLIPEWYEHQCCLIAWPCNKDLYGKIINKARDEVANVINEIAKTEHVIVLSNKGDINEIQNKNDYVLDLYSGSGTFTLPLLKNGYNVL